MKLSDFSEFLLCDASGEKLKLALCDARGAVLRSADSQERAMEAFFGSLAEICPDADALANVNAVALCTGTGSILGTRTASVGLCTIAKFTGAEIFEWNCMEVAARALADAGRDGFSLFTPSRKGYANILVFESGVSLLREIELAEIEAVARGDRILLKQREKNDPAFSDFEIFELDDATAAATLAKHAPLAHHCTSTPDAKSLTEREYVKWKAQAHI